MSQSPSIESLLVTGDATIQRALEIIDANAEGTAIVVDGDGRLAGVLTDGDVRRHLLRQGTLGDAVSLAMTAACVRLPVTAPSDVILSTVTRSIRIVPLLDETGRPVDFASYGRLHRIPIMEPTLAGNEMTYVTDCLRTGWISSQGTYVKRFEQEFARYVEVPHAIAVSNGTVALHLIVVSLGIGAGDEVIVPNLTFAASANAVIHAGATPVLADVDPETWTIDVESARSLITPRTRAIMPVHLYGQPSDMTGLQRLADAHGLTLIEDAAESLGARYRGVPTGAIGEAGAFSFFGNKLITTGEGGMVTCRSDTLAQRARMLRDHGMDPARRYWHVDVGYNYRMTNVQAAIGTAQLEQIDHLFSRKLALAARYIERLAGVPWLRLPTTRPDCVSSHWLFTISLDERAAGIGRDALIGELLSCGVESRPVFHPLDRMPPYRDLPRAASLDVSHAVAASGLSLPSSAKLDDDSADFVCETLIDVVARRSRRRRRVS